MGNQASDRQHSLGKGGQDGKAFCLLAPLSGHDSQDIGGSVKKLEGLYLWTLRSKELGLDEKREDEGQRDSTMGRVLALWVTWI